MSFSTLENTKSRKLEIGSIVKPWGKIGAKLITCGEPYYMLLAKDGTVALLPAKMVQHHADLNP